MNRIDLFVLATLLPAALLVAAGLFARHGLLLLGRMWRERDHRDSAFWLVRGGRGIIVALACVAIAAGLAFEARGLLWFGVAFLAEELYETGMVLLVLRWGRRRSERPAAVLGALARS